MYNKDCYIYEDISRQAMDFLNIDEEHFIISEIYEAMKDSENAIHCFFSPSKSNGWAICPAYLDRQKAWAGSNEAAIRGTITHHFMSRIINLLKKPKTKEDYEKIDLIIWGVLHHGDWLTKSGVDSARVLISKCVKLGLETTTSEIFLMSDRLGEPNRNLRFGGSIDLLNVDKEHSTVYIYDLKTGKHEVDPNCWQLKCYAGLVREKIEDARDCKKFVLGIGQNGKIKECEIGNEELDCAMRQVKKAMEGYRDYVDNDLNEVIVEVEQKFDHCFHENPYCRFCKGCYKRERF